MQFSVILKFSIAWAVFYILIVGLLGACFGSFINCMAWRITHGESVWKGRSHCATCNHILAPIDLVPVVSWLLLKGRCRYCGQRISPRYMITEIILGVYFISILIVYGVTVEAVALWALGCVLLGLSLVDLETYTIPNGFIVAGIAIWLVTFAFFGVDPACYRVGRVIRPLVSSDWLAVFIDGMLGAVVVAGALLLLALLFDKIIKRQSLGGGDVKLVFVLGLYLGLSASVLNIIIACVIGIVFAFATQAHRKDNEDPKAFPFGPSLALAAWITLLFGSPLINAYLSLF